MNAYFIAQIKIHNPEGYKKYLEGFDEIFEKYKGEVIIADDDPIVLEGSWNYTRVVMIRFPNEEELRLWYDSPEYQALAKYRQKASQADILIVKGRN
jgi:uncharacterized protein (DUF1330 family)